MLITFTGGEESDVLHAAGSWMAEHLYAVIVALDWRGDQTDDAKRRLTMLGSQETKP